MLLNAFQSAMHYMPYWLLAINLITFFVYRADKKRAIRKKWRIPERTLFLLAFIGGSIGAFAGMLLCRHKTKHRTFMIGVPCILLFHFSLLCLYLKFF